MKNLTFLRHYKLAYPFDHWSHMSLKQFVDFNEGRVDPPIDPTVSDFLAQNDLFPGDVEVIVCGTKRRTRETADAIVRWQNNKVDVQHSDLFDEIPLKFIKIPTSKDFEAMKKHKRLIVDKVRALNSQEKQARLVGIDSYLDNLSYSSILVISHSYLIGLLRYWYTVINRDTSRFNADEADKYEVGGVLKGFSVEIN